MRELVNLVFLILGLILLGSVLWEAFRAWRAHHRGHGYPYRETVIVNLKSGKAFRGVLWQRTSGYLVLKQAELLRPGVNPTPVDGDTLVPSGDVEFLQVVQVVKAG